MGNTKAIAVPILEKDFLRKKHIYLYTSTQVFVCFVKIYV